MPLNLSEMAMASRVVLIRQASVGTNLRKEKVDAERCLGIVEPSFQVVDHRLQTCVQPYVHACARHVARTIESSH